jgi:hypothetical protein
MLETLAGSGKLSDGFGTTARAVHFKFEIAWELIPGPWGQPAKGNPRGRGGSISADDGQPIGEGIYRIVESDGKQWRVQKLGMQWHLLSPPGA